MNSCIPLTDPGRRARGGAPRHGLALRVAAAVLGLTASAATAAPVPIGPERWDIAGEAQFVERDGRQAIHIGPGPDLPLKGGEASIRNSNFTTGTIEFDMLVDAGRDFAGLIFRGSEDGNGELFYLRPHMNGNPDSIQYTPVVHGNLEWQIFSGEGFESKVRFNYGHWMHVRADIYRESALISVDGAPVLAVPHLKSRSRSGSIGFTAAGSAYFANLDATPIGDYRDPHPVPPPPPLPAGSVASWLATPAMAEEDALARAARSDWTGLKWLRIPAESNGIGNLSRTGPDAEGKHSFIARFTLRSAAARRATLHFGFSDKVRIFLNGRALYEGEDLQGSRDYRFLGIVGFWDTLFLPLEAGANDVVFVVTDNTNGGTAAAARFDPDPAIAIEQALPSLP
jgi:hypothetical protein